MEHARRCLREVAEIVRAYAAGLQRLGGHAERVMIRMEDARQSSGECKTIEQDLRDLAHRPGWIADCARNRPKLILLRGPEGLRCCNKPRKGRRCVLRAWRQASPPPLQREGGPSTSSRRNTRNS